MQLKFNQEKLQKDFIKHKKRMRNVVGDLDAIKDTLNMIKWSVFGALALMGLQMVGIAEFFKMTFKV